MTRFTHWDRPLAYPFFDLVLRDTGEGGCFDLSVLLEDYTGSVYVRDEHIVEMGRSLGMASIEEVTALKARIKELEDEQNRLPKAQEELKSGLDNLVSEFQLAIRGDSAVISVDSEEPEPEPTPTVEDIRESIKSFSV